MCLLPPRVCRPASLNPKATTPQNASTHLPCNGSTHNLLGRHNHALRRRSSFTEGSIFSQDGDEDFTTIGAYLHGSVLIFILTLHYYTTDWIEDAIVERNRRLRVARDALAGRRGPNGEITLHWLFGQARALFDASQTWIVVSIAGEHCLGFVPFSTHTHTTSLQARSSVSTRR